MPTSKTTKSGPAAQATFTFPPHTPDSVCRLVQLFEAHRDDLKFPDVDAASLTKALDATRERRAAAEQAAEALSVACQQLAEMERSLLEQARRGHAYASIYAANNPEIMNELGEVKLGAPERAPRKRRPDPSASTDPSAPTSEARARRAPHEPGSTTARKIGESEDAASTPAAQDAQAAE